MKTGTEKVPLFWDQDEPHRLVHTSFPRASRYHPQWVFENQMGPNVLWLCEYLAAAVDLKPGMRILDLGCGMGLSSIFWAFEYGVEVWANDLWIDASSNYRRFCAAGVDRRVFPIHAEAHLLPYADEFFDAIVSLDAYHYFGTDQLYLGYISKFLKRDGQLGIVVPGLHRPWAEMPPAHLNEPQSHGGRFWAWDMAAFQTAAWWQNLLGQYPFFAVETCTALDDGGTLWLDWERRLADYPGDKLFPPDIEALEADDNRYLTFIRAVGRRTAAEW